MKKWQKVSLGCLGTTLTVCGIAALAIYGLVSFFFLNELILEVPSPDGKLKAVMFNRAGPLEPFSTQVSIVSARAGLPKFNGNVLRTDGLMDESNIQIKWTGSRSMVITRHEDYETYLAEPLARGVSVEHRITKEKANNTQEGIGEELASPSE
jgi:hypothetical protein